MFRLSRAFRVRPTVRPCVKPALFKSEPFKPAKRFYPGGYRAEGGEDGLNFKWFLLVAVFGTAVFVKIAQRIKEQDNSPVSPKNKKSFTESEWAEQVKKMNEKRYVFNGEAQEFYLVPFGAKTQKKTTDLVNKLGGEDTVATINLNDLIKRQLEDPNSPYGVLLNDTLDKENNDSDGCFYTFTYRLAPGIFTQLVKNEITAVHKKNSKLTRFVVVNYPNTIEEAVKFEQKVGIVTKLVTEGNEPEHSNIVDYFSTVDKVISEDKVAKVEPLVITSQSQAATTGAATPATNDLSTPPPDNAPAIQKAQYRLRELHQPIRRYGETDQDVINRLGQLQK